MLIKYDPIDEPTLVEPLYQCVLKFPSKVTNYDNVQFMKDVRISQLVGLFSNDKNLYNLWSWCYKPYSLLYSKMKNMSGKNIIFDPEDIQLTDPIGKRAGIKTKHHGNFLWTMRSAPSIGIQSTTKLDQISHTDLNTRTVRSLFENSNSLDYVRENGFIFSTNLIPFGITNNPDRRLVDPHTTEKKVFVSDTLLASSLHDGNISKSKESSYMNFTFSDIDITQLLVRSAIYIVANMKHNSKDFSQQAKTVLNERVEVNPKKFENNNMMLSFVIRENNFIRIDEDGVTIVYVPTDEVKRRIIRLVLTCTLYDIHLISSYTGVSTFFDWPNPSSLMKKYENTVIFRSREEIILFANKPLDNQVYSEVLSSHYSYYYKVIIPKTG